MQRRFDSSIIRKLASDAFSDHELDVFCFDYFSSVYEQFCDGMGKLVKIQLLLDFCMRRQQFEILLKQIEHVNPGQFQKYATSLYKVDNDTHPSKPGISWTRIEITLPINVSDIDEKTRDIAISAAIGALAAALDISKDQVNLLKVSAGSLILDIEVQLLQNLVFQRLTEPALKELGISGVKTYSSSLRDYIDKYIPLVEQRMQFYLGSAHVSSHTEPFLTMLNYHLGFSDADGKPSKLNAGKRIRPLLLLLSCEACGLDPLPAINAAAALELFHNFTLIHDDIEDGDELRRGRPTLWKQWGVAQAINVGDALFIISQIALADTVSNNILASRVLQAMRAFNDIGLKLTIGQYLDLSFESRIDITDNDYLNMISGKTSALVAGACEIGAILAGADSLQVKNLSNFGHNVGLAFQLQDDVLGIWSDPKATGKANSDLHYGKKTLPVIYAAMRDPKLSELYFSHRYDQTMLSNSEVELVRQLIEDAGGRQYAEQTVEIAYRQALQSLESANVQNNAGLALRDLANSLLGRDGEV